MNEFAIEWVRGSLVATVTFPSSSKMKSKLLKLAAEYPEEVDYIENEDGSVCGHIPVKYIKISHPRKVSDEQKQQAAQRLKLMRENNLI